MALALLVLAAGLAPVGIAVVMPLLVLAGAASVCGTVLSSSAGSTFLLAISLVTYSARWAVAALFYAASAYGWPFGRSLQVEHGFWSFAMDAYHYHVESLALTRAIQQGLPLPPIETAIDYHIVVVALYRLFGTSPLVAIAFNIVAWTVATVLLVALFQFLRGRPVPCASIVVIACWPSGFIWPTQVMKDAITLLAVVAAALAVTRLLASRRTLEAVAGVLGLAVALVFIVRLRLYIGRMLLAATVVAGAAGAVTAVVRGAALWPRLTKSLLAAAVVAIGLNLITAPDAKSVLALHYGGWLSRAQKHAAPAGPAATTPETATPETTAPVVPAPAGLVGRAHRLSARLAAMVRAFSPDQLIAFRQRFALTGGNSVASAERVSGWADLLALAPRALFDAVLSPYPWDVVRPRGITGPFRTFAVLEPMLTLLLLPAIVLGLSRVRRTEEWLIAVLAVGGLFTMGLVFPNLGTMFRLRVPFVMLLVGFSALGFDAYGRLATVVSGSRLDTRLPS